MNFNETTVFSVMKSISDKDDLTSLYMGLAGVCLVIVVISITLVSLVLRAGLHKSLETKRQKLLKKKKSTNSTNRWMTKLLHSIHGD